VPWGRVKSSEKSFPIKRKNPLHYGTILQDNGCAVFDHAKEIISGTFGEQILKFFQDLLKSKRSKQ
jgi:hypothetical protein